MTYTLPDSLTVREIVHGKTLSCSPDTSVLEASKLMHRHRFSSILVEERGRVIGVWTEQDALRLKPGQSLATTPMAQVMSSPVKSIHEDTPLSEAAIEFKQKGIRHLLVVRTDGSALGIISQTDMVVTHSVEFYMSMWELGEVIRSCGDRIPCSAPLSQATELMSRTRCDALLVTFADNDFGILTERDVLRHVSHTGLCEDATVADVASRELICARVSDTLYHTRNLMLQKRIRHIGVRDDHDQLLGMISFSDILTTIEYAYVEELKKNLQKRTEALHTSTRNLQLAERVIEASLNGIFITDAKGVIQSVNQSFTRITGYTPEDAIGQTPALLASGHHDAGFYQQMWQEIGKHGSWHGEVWNRRKSGELYAELLTISAIHDDDHKVVNYTAIFSDITQTKNDEERIKRLAYYDSLTNLPNRRLFEDRLAMALALARRQQSHLALLFVDMDDFKSVNDTHGHHTGDELIRHCAAQLTRTVRDSDTVARIGGDEFVVISQSVADHHQLRELAQRLLTAASTPMNHGDTQVIPSISIGAALFPDHGEDKRGLMSRADQAMYQAKSLGKNRYCLAE